MIPQEEWFFLHLLSRKPDDVSVRKLIEMFERLAGRNARKRAHLLLEKWIDRGWYRSGISIDSGRLTPEGYEIAADGMVQVQGDR